MGQKSCMDMTRKFQPWDNAQVIVKIHLQCLFLVPMILATQDVETGFASALVKQAQATMEHVLRCLTTDIGYIDILQVGPVLFSLQYKK